MKETENISPLRPLYSAEEARKLTQSIEKKHKTAAIRNTQRAITSSQDPNTLDMHEPSAELLHARKTRTGRFKSVTSYYHL